MPRSSGGGSRGGGSRGGGSRSRSHGGRHRSGSSIPPIRLTPYPGARRYRYYRGGRYHYFYTARQGKVFSPARLVLGFVYIPFLLPIGASLLASVSQYVVKNDAPIVIKDEANLLEDDSGLENALSEFYEKTNITPAIITVNNESWQNNYSSLEDYAYDRYLIEFTDEMHCVFVK